MISQVLQLSDDNSQVQTDVEAGRRVLDLASDAISQLSRELNGDFARAVALFAQVKGRIIVTGMGKSGHIASKIAATFASTGAPAQYVHPAEASHGDLGMITSDDAILALSNSGETKELSDLLQFSRRFSIPMVAITSRAKSTLAETADIALILSDRPEAGALGLAPTTSTTMTLALGDAIAVALLERKGFSAQDFHTFHPGGKLGQQLVRVRDLMHTGDEVPLTANNPTMRDAILIMAEKRFGCIGVQDKDGKLIGIVTDGDLRRHMSNDLLDRHVEDIMTQTPKTTTPDILAMEVLNQMNNADHPFTTIFVEDEGKPVGIVHMHDLLRAGIA